MRTLYLWFEAVHANVYETQIFRNFLIQLRYWHITFATNSDLQLEKGEK